MTQTISFSIMHFSVAFGVAYLLTGDVAIGGAVALVEPAVNTVAYHFHEKIWRRIRCDTEPANGSTSGVGLLRQFKVSIARIGIATAGEPLD